MFIENQTEVNTCAYRNTDKTSICSSTLQRFSLTLVFILLGQESPECFLFPKSRKISAFLWSKICFFDPSQSYLILEIWKHCACDYSAKSFPSFLCTTQCSSRIWQTRAECRSTVTSLRCSAFVSSPFRPFLPRAVSRFLLSQKGDSCFDNGYCASH